MNGQSERSGSGLGAAAFRFFTPEGRAPAPLSAPDLVGPLVAASQSIVGGIDRASRAVSEGLEKRQRRQEVEGAIDNLEELLSDEGSFEQRNVMPAQYGGIGGMFLERAGGDIAQAEAMYSEYLVREEGMSPVQAAALAQDPFSERTYRVLRPSANNAFMRAATVIRSGSGVPVDELRRSLLAPGVFMSGTEIDEMYRAIAQKDLAPLAERRSSMQQAVGTGEGSLALSGRRREEAVADIEATRRQGTASDVSGFFLSRPVREAEAQEADENFRRSARSKTVAGLQGFELERGMRAEQTRERLDEIIAQQGALISQKFAAERSQTREVSAERGAAHSAAIQALSSEDMGIKTLGVKDMATIAPSLHSQITAMSRDPEISGTARGRMLTEFLKEGTGVRMLEPGQRAQLISDVQSTSGATFDEAMAAVDTAAMSMNIMPTPQAAAEQVSAIATAIYKSGEEAAGTIDYLGGKAANGASIFSSRAQGLLNSALDAEKDPAESIGRLSKPISMDQLLGSIGQRGEGFARTARGSGVSANTEFAKNAMVSMELSDDKVRLTYEGKNPEPGVIEFIREVEGRFQPDLRKLAIQSVMGTPSGSEIGFGESMDLWGWLKGVNAMAERSGLKSGKSDSGEKKPAKKVSNPLGFGITPDQLGR